MSVWPDYDLNDESTWVVMEPPTVDRSWEEQLTHIGDLNPFGKANLVWRWGPTYCDPMAVDGGLKYWIGNAESKLIGFEFTDPVTGLTLMVEKLGEVPRNVLVSVPKYTGLIPLGQRRIVIEQWRSPEFLGRSGRYTETMLRDPDSVQQFFFCKNCELPLPVGDDGPSPCQCGSKRSILREVREPGDGKLLRSFPSEGCYDCFLILENANGEPMPPDANALSLIEKHWHEQQTKSLKDQMKDSLAETAGQEDLARAATSPNNPFQPPPVQGW